MCARQDSLCIRLYCISKTHLTLDIFIHFIFTVYQTERNGQNEAFITYEIPVPLGNYEILIHMAELYWQIEGGRVFDLEVEGQLFEDVDVFKLAGNARYKAFTLDVYPLVDDGAVSIRLTNKIDWAKVSGIEIKLQSLHTAHAVANGPVSFICGTRVCCVGSFIIYLSPSLFSLFKSTRWSTKIMMAMASFR